MNFIIKNHKISIALFLLLAIIMITNITYAVSFTDADTFVSTGKSQSALNDGAITEIGKEFTELGSILMFIGAGIVVGATAYMGILYIISPPEKQAKLKQQLVGLLVSACVIFGAYYIWKIVVNFLETAIG